MAKEIKKEYTNGDLTVVWKPKMCIHSGICVKTRPDVYKPGERPWIQPERTGTEELKAQIDQCPSGALSYYLNAEGPGEEDTTLGKKVIVAENGPLLVRGTLTVTKANGEEETRVKQTAFCRCGASKNKPYCDGSHKKIDFVG